MRYLVTTILIAVLFTLACSGDVKPYHPPVSDLPDVTSGPDVEEEICYPDDRVDPLLWRRGLVPLLCDTEY